MILKTIIHLSDDYRQMVALRTRILLLPSGIPAAYIVPESEAADVHIGAFEKDTIVGCCVLTPRGAGQVQLRQMAVDGQLQGKGFGATIIAFAEQQAKDTGFDLLYLHARKPVIPFYEKCGYAIAGPLFLEAGLEHHRMEKRLA